MIFARFYGTNPTFSGSTTRRLTARFQLYGWLNKWASHDQNHSLLDDQKEGTRKPRRDSRQWLGACCLVLFLIEPFGLVGVFAKEQFGFVNSQLILWNDWVFQLQCRQHSGQPQIIPNEMRQNSGCMYFVRSKCKSVICAGNYGWTDKYGTFFHSVFLRKQILRQFFLINSNIKASRKYLVWKNHISNSEINALRVQFTNFFLSFNNCFCKHKIICEHFSFDQYIQSWRFTNIFEIKFYLYADRVVFINEITCRPNIYLNPRPLIGNQRLSKSFVRFIKYPGTQQSADNQKGSPNYKPFGQPNYWITLSKPPPWFWLALLATATVSFFVSFVLLPDTQPASTIRNRLSLTFYILGIALALTAFPVAVFGN